MTEQPAPVPSGEQSSKAPVIAVLRIAGAFFMIAGGVAFFDAGGFASGLFGFDAFMCRVFGGMLFMVGATDFFVIPLLLRGKDGNGGDKAL